MTNYTDSDLPPILDKIQAKGFWRVVLRPTVYAEKRVPTLTSCRQIVEASTVRLRGWDYPHMGTVDNKQSWVESSEDWLHGHIEFWRFYQSGQFVHHFAMSEDYEESSKDRLGLDFVNTLYRFTETLEFSARLAAREVLSPGANLRVELHGCEGRRLISWDPGRMLSGTFISSLPVIAFDAAVTEADLLGRSAEIAVDATVDVLERFNWSDVPREILAAEQTRFLERRL